MDAAVREMVGDADYVTEFRERETDKPLWRQGQVLGDLTFEKGVRPFPDRVAHYEQVDVYAVEGNGVDAVLEVADLDADDVKPEQSE